MIYTCNFLRNNKRLWQYIASFSAMLITACSGLHYGWTSPYMLVLLGDDSPIPMSNEQSSWVAVSYLIAGPCGSITNGIILNILGRKPVLIASALSFLASWLIIALASNWTTLLIARSLAGFTDGFIFGTSSIYIAEIVDQQIRGFICSFIAVIYVIGIILMNVMGTYLTLPYSALVSASLPIILLMIFVSMPESPHYLLMKGQVEKARKSLEMLRPTAEVDQELQDITKSVEEDASVKFLNMFKSKVHRKSLLVVMGLRSSQQLSGIVVFIFYAQTLFQEASDDISSLMSVVILHSVQIVFFILSSIFIDKIGRRPLLIASTSIMAGALLVEGMFFYLRDNEYVDVKELQWLPIGSLIVFMIAYSIGMHTIPLLIVGELFPTNIRAYAAALSDIYYFVFAFIASKFFQVTKDASGLYVSFLTFSACTAISLILMIFFVPETKNKTLHEIQLELKNVK